MENELKTKLKNVFKEIKNIPDIEQKSIEEISELFKSKLSSSLEMTPERWKKLKNHKKLNFDLENMSVEEKSLDSFTEKFAKKIKKEKEEKIDAKESKYKFTITFNNSKKRHISSLERFDGIQAVRFEIIKQAQAQGITVEMLERPCNVFKNSLTKSQINFPENTKFIDAATTIAYLSIMGKDSFANADEKEDSKPSYRPKSSAEELMEDMLGKNDIKLTADNISEYERMPGMY